MNFKEFAEIISIFLTSPTIIFALAVLFIWFKEAKDSFTNRQKEAINWLVMGVFVGFFGTLIENFYWLLYWSSSFIDPEHTNSKFSQCLVYYGVFPNIFFRQGCGILAAYCHLKSYTVMAGKKGFSLKLLGLSTILGILYVLFLLYMKW